MISDQLLEELVTKLYRENPQLERHTLQEFYEDHKIFVPGYVPNELKPFLANINVKMLQSAGDTITPTPIAKDFIKDTKISYEESRQEHAFTQDRQEVIEKVLSFFK